MSRSLLLRELWNYRELFYFLALRDVKVRYKQTVFGVAWVIIQPLFTMLVFTVLFGRVAKIPTDGTPHAVFYFSGLLPWIYFSSRLNLVGNCLVTNVPLVKKVYFPRIILPSAVALAGLVDLCIGSLLLGVILLYHGIGLSWSMLLWPVLMVPLFVVTMGLGMFLAAVNVKYRDVRHALPFIVQIGIFLTPVIYPVRAIPEHFQFLLSLNPMSGLVEMFRFSITPGRDMDWAGIGVSFAVVIAVFLGSLMYFRSAEREFADIV
ncbi:MAG: ABC transporter permease [Luteitalea sp.]|nr:ABC transporter permease [Luteitalea sp.]